LIEILPICILGKPNTMWTCLDSIENSRTNSSEPQNRQKALVLKALVADLSFWGDLNTFQEGKGDNYTEPLTAAVANSIMPMEQALQSSETRTTATATETATLNTTSATPSAAGNNNNSRPIWKTAVDAQSGKTYYYDMVSRRTQWEKVSCQLLRFCSQQVFNARETSHVCAAQPL
jgi:hypothetical protein